MEAMLADLLGRMERMEGRANPPLAEEGRGQRGATTTSDEDHLPRERYVQPPRVREEDDGYHPRREHHRRRHGETEEEREDVGKITLPPI